MKTLEILFTSGERLTVNVTSAFKLPPAAEQIMLIDTVEGAQARVSLMMVLWMSLK